MLRRLVETGFSLGKLGLESGWSQLPPSVLFGMAVDGAEPGGSIPGPESDVFANASTITSWLQTQPQDVKVQ